MAKLSRLMVAALQECRDASDPGPQYGMREALKRATMPKLAALGLVERHEKLRGHYGGPSFIGWRITEAGRAALPTTTPPPSAGRDEDGSKVHV